MPRVPQKKDSPKAESNRPIATTEAEITGLINQLSVMGMDSNIDSTVRVINRAEAKDKVSLHKLSIKGPRLQRRLAALALAFLEQDDVYGATAGPNLALRHFFQFSRQHSSAWRSWIAERRFRVSESETVAAPADADSVGEESDSDRDEKVVWAERMFDLRHALMTANPETLDGVASLLGLSRAISGDKQPAKKDVASPLSNRSKEKIELIKRHGEATGPTGELFMLSANDELISPDVATAMLNLAYEALGVPLKSSPAKGKRNRHE